MTFASFGGNFWANWHARTRAIHQGTKVRLLLPRVVVVEEKTLNLLAPPFRDCVMLMRLRFSLSSRCHSAPALNDSMIVAAARRALLSSRSRHLQRQRER